MADKVQQYTLGDRIGTGSTGTVRRARHNEDKTDVAIKTLQPDIARDPATRKRLLASRKQLQAVPAHGNIARVLDIVEQGDTLHIVMEYAPGKSLESTLGRKSRPMNQETAVNVLNQVLRGAIAAHSKGVIHGSLKPSDIILAAPLSVPVGGEDSTTPIKVSGFGIAKNLNTPALLRAAGRSQTLPYLAPEQVRGESSDERTDVYSAGMILYRMITGKLPFWTSERGAEARIRNAILNEPLPDIAEAMPELLVSPHIQTILRRALAKDRRERIPTMREFLRLVQKAQTELAAQAAAQTSPATEQTTVSSAIPVATALVGGASALAASATPTTPPTTESNTSSPATGSASPSSAEPSLWNVLSKPSDIKTPAPEGSPSLTKTATQVEIERRMQALRIEKERQIREDADAAIAKANAEAVRTASPFASSASPQQAVSLASHSVASFPPPPQPNAPSGYESDKSEENAPQTKEKKRRSVVPWFVVGAIALGGGIYYVALKNNNNPAETNKQQPLSKEAVEQQYDTLQNKLSDEQIGQDDEQSPYPSDIEQKSNENTGEEADKQIDQQADNEVNAKPTADAEHSGNATTTEPKKSSDGSNVASPLTQTEQINKQTNKQANNTTAPAEKVENKVHTKANETINTDKSRTQSQSSQIPPPPVLSSSPSSKDAPKSEQSTSKKSATTKPARSHNNFDNTEKLAPTSKNSTRNSPEAKTSSSRLSPDGSVRGASSSAAQKQSLAAQNTRTNISSANSASASPPSSKSGSLASYNAEQDGEREAARKKIQQKYAAHLSKKQPKSQASDNTKLVARTSPSSTISSPSDGKRIPSALKSRESVTPYSIATPSRASKRNDNRSDDYEPIKNPVDAAYDTDQSARDLEEAARKAAHTEPYLLLRGHVATVRSVSFSPDGKLIASGSDDKTVKIWDASTGTILRSLRGHGNAVTSVFFSPDSKFIISSGKDKTVRIWDVETGNPIQRSPGVSCEGSPAAFSPDGGFIATANNRNISITKVQK